ncbi:phosphatidylinositol-3-phosphatase ymr1 [Paramarasmius palmivorus]|uniref:Phosphatidylinositol-3-phosphatase ymr1 n=1 Tax=Paramarasmius palmivorus TaxID=297713 RepID=A0AAW0DT32_9AGAR
MRFSTAAATLLSVAVGDGGLAFNPSSLTAPVGDTVQFQFVAKNHSVTQSTFDNPCVFKDQGVDSGFLKVDTNATEIPSWSFQIDSTDALWFFCAQMSTGLATAKGMVFALNPTAEKSFDAYKAKAMNNAAEGGAAGASGSASASGAAPTASESAAGGAGAHLVLHLAPTLELAPHQLLDSNGALGMSGNVISMLSISGLVLEPMDSIRIPKVEGVRCTKGGSTLSGTIHLTAHHLIFRYDEEKEKEMWIPYPLISLVTRLPQTLLGQCPVTFHTRTFETFSIEFTKESDAIDVFDSVKELTVATSVNQLYAFFYQPNPPFPTNDGWSIYNPREEFGRMGVGTRTKAWRFTDVNKDYSFSPTYPAKMLIPTKISDTTLQYASKYRSKCRIPVLTYLHWSNFASITRSSQPMVGLTQNRSIQDEKLIETIFQSHFNPDSRVSNAPIYGATTTNLIIDARPTTNAVANTAKGAGTENMDHYKEGKKVYLGIDHIHTMREALAKVVETLREADTLLASINNDLSGQISGVSVLDRQALRRSGWLRHISIILEGTNLITRNIHVNSSHVLIHCSDGWDRTSQLSAIAQLCLDPFYRTIRGFEILIEKDWLSYGHKFMDRCGHLSSEKFFIAPVENSGGGGGGAEVAQGFLASVQNRFTSQSHLKETSPIFHQFLETVRQIQRQFPERFERLGFHEHPSEMEQNLNPQYDPSLDDPTNRASNADMGVLFPNPKDVRFWHELYGRTDDEMNGRNMPIPRSPEVVGPVEGTEDDPVINRISTPSNIPLPPSPSKPASATLPRSRSPNLIYESPSVSDPEIAKPNPLPRVDSFRPFSTSGSSFSMKSNLSPQLPSSSSSPTSRPNARTQDLLGVGVRSMWGKLSSNASAAFSVVQEAYGGVAKDLNWNANITSGSERTEELQGRETLGAWGNDAPVSSGSATLPTSTASYAGPRLGKPMGVCKDILEYSTGDLDLR